MASLLVVSHLVLIWLTRGLTHANATTIASVVPLIVGLAVPTALLLLATPASARLKPSRAAIAIVFAAGLAMRAIWLGVPPPLEDDFNRYLWDGAVLAHGLDPYAHAPLEFLGSAAAPPSYARLVETGHAILGGVNFPDLRTIYPSTALASFALAHLVAPFDVDGLRVVFLAAEVATFLLLIVLLARIGASPLWSMLYWWNPTVAFCLIGIVHVDALLPPLLFGALLAMSRDRRVTAVAFLGAAAGVKFWPILLVPLALVPIGRERARLVLCSILLCGVLILAIGPVLLSLWQPGSGLGAYASGWANNNAPFAWGALLLGAVVGEQAAQLASRTAMTLGAIVAALLVARTADTSIRSILRAGLIVAAVVFYLSPAQFPWYAVWFLPLAAVLQCWPLLVASASLPAYYFFFPLAATGRGHVFQLGLAFLHAAPVLGWWLVDLLRRRGGTLPGGLASKERAQ